KMQRPSRIIVAAPMISKFAVEKLSKAVDEIIAVLVPENYYRVSGFYLDFKEVSDDDVVECLDKLYVPDQMI
ncbi:MAG: phosphoribosyltransferase, partial [Candidatus Dadabacteria bacterium]